MFLIFVHSIYYCYDMYYYNAIYALPIVSLVSVILFEKQEESLSETWMGLVPLMPLS